MDWQSGRLRRSTGLVILLFFAPFLFGEAGGMEEVRQDGPGEIQAEWKSHIVEGQRFTLKYITSFKGLQAVKSKEPVWPEGIKKISGPFSAQKTLLLENGSYGTVLQLIYTLKAGKAGIYTIPPIEVRDGLEIQVSKAVTLPVLRKDEAHLKYPLMLDWEALPEFLYRGQAFPLVLQIRNMERIVIPDSVSLEPSRGSILEPLQGQGDIRASLFDGDSLFRVPVGSWMLTPSKEGVVKLNAAEVRIMGLKRKTPALEIPVKPLPPELEGSGAVGQFKYALVLPEKALHKGEPGELVIRVEGTGNLNYLVLPEPEFPQELGVIRTEASDYAAAPDGFQGWRELRFTMNAEKAGEYNLEIPGFYWLNPEKGNLFHSPARRVKLNILDGAEGQKDEQKFALIPFDDLPGGKAYSLYARPLMYLLFLPGLLFFLLVRAGIFRKIFPFLLAASFFILTSGAVESRDSLSWARAGEKAFSRGEWKEALSLYESREGRWKRNAFFLHNKGILLYLNGQHAQGVAALRQAVRIKSSEDILWKSLLQVEEALHLERQHEYRVFFSPNTLFVLLFILVNLAFIFGGLNRLYPQRALYLAFSVISLFISLGGAVELMRTVLELNREEGIIRKDLFIKKIPEFRARPWIKLAEGTSVYVDDVFENYVLIHTSSGLEGWVFGKDLIMVKR